MSISHAQAFFRNPGAALLAVLVAIAAAALSVTGLSPQARA